MNEHLLSHMYQAWQQGNNDFVTDYKFFVNFVSKHFDTDYDTMFSILKNYCWFHYLPED